MPEMSAEARAYLENVLEPRERDALARYTEAADALWRARSAINGVLIGEGLGPRFNETSAGVVQKPGVTAATGGAPASHQSGAAAGGWKVYGLGTFVKSPMQTAIRTILSDRFSAAGGATDRALASIDEIYDAMKAGSFPFPSKDADKAKDGLRVSIGRRKEFIRVVGPAGPVYGRAEWYATTKQARAGVADGKESPDAD